MGKKADYYNELLNAQPRIQECETPDSDDIAGTIVAWDFERSLKSFVQNRKEMTRVLAVHSIWLENGEVLVQEFPTFGTIRR